MIDISDELTDGERSVHRARFTENAAFDPLDLEAAAHHVFDQAIAVHLHGWCKPALYQKKAMRGRLSDLLETSVERRLASICDILKHTKAAVDDVMRGGITLALLCDNPVARSSTKIANNTGNEKRGQRLKVAKDLEEADRE